MSCIQRFPFVLSAIMTIIIGSISYKNTDEFKTICIKMAFALVIFYVTGIFVKRVILEINDEVTRKREEEINNTDKDNTNKDNADKDNVDTANMEAEYKE